MTVPKSLYYILIGNSQIDRSAEIKYYLHFSYIKNNEIIGYINTIQRNISGINGGGTSIVTVGYLEKDTEIGLCFYNVGDVSVENKYTYLNIISI